MIVRPEIGFVFGFLGIEILQWKKIMAVLGQNQ